MILTEGRTGRPRPSVGMLTLDLLEMVAEQWLGAVGGAEDAGCDLISFCSGRAIGMPGSHEQATAIYDLATAETLDGLVVWTSLLGIYDGLARLTAHIRQLPGLPIVSVEEPLGSAPVILMDNRGGMNAVVSHLIEVHGRRRIAFVRGPARHPGAEERYRGYLDALREHGLPEDPALVSANTTSWYAEEAADAVRPMLFADDPPDAVAAANDDFAVAVLSVIAELPSQQEVSVVGFDDVTDIRTQDLGFAVDDEPGGSARRAVNITAESLSLTTVHAPFQELGRRAVETVAAMIRGESVPRVVTVPTEPVIRRSCGCRPTLAGILGPDGARDDLREVLSGRSAALPADWPQRLSSAFVDALVGNGGEAFATELDNLVRESMRAGEAIENWWRALNVLRQRADRIGAHSARVEDVMLRAELSLNETAARHWHYAQVLTEKRNQVVREVGQRVITAANLADLAGILADQLPRIGIPGCYLAVYQSGSGPRERARSLLVYERGDVVEVPEGARVFGSAELVPGDRLRRDAPFSVIALPLFFQDQQLGFVLLENGPRIGWIYAALQEQLSSALHRAFLVERERAALEAVEQAHRREERHRLAGELHDSVSQALFSMTLQTRAIELSVRKERGELDGPIGRGLAELRSLTQGALAEMRALIFQLRPTVLREEGLVAAIRQHAAEVAARGLFAVHVEEVPSDRLTLNEDAEQDVFRIVQEALHNSAKHAHPSRVDIRIATPGGSTLIVEIADDGDGFDPDLPRPGHLGLVGMRERAERLDGTLEIDAAPGKPTKIRLEVPNLLRPGQL